jgi:hypothetical protein
LAIRVALQHANRLTHLLVVGGGTALPPLPDKGGAGGAAEGQEGTSTTSILEDMRKIMDNNFFNKALITPKLLQQRLEMRVGKNFEAFIERSKAREPQGGGVPLYKRLTEISVPLLPRYGKQDRGSAAQLLRPLERTGAGTAHQAHRQRRSSGDLGTGRQIQRERPAFSQIVIKSPLTDKILRQVLNG